MKRIEKENKQLWNVPRPIEDFVKRGLKIFHSTLLVKYLSESGGDVSKFFFF